MARQDVSPEERDVARAKLTEAGLGWDVTPIGPTVTRRYHAGTGTASVSFSGNGTVFVRIVFG